MINDTEALLAVLKTPSNTVGISTSLLTEGGEIKLREVAIAGKASALKKQILKNLAQDFNAHSPIAKTMGTRLIPRNAISETICRFT